MDMICAVCAFPFLNAASLIVFRPIGKPDFMIHGRGGNGLLELFRLVKNHPNYILTINTQEVSDFTPVTQVNGTLVCAVHVFDMLERLNRRGML